jgi:hypothetical protein
MLVVAIDIDKVKDELDPIVIKYLLSKKLKNLSCTIVSKFLIKSKKIYEC